MPDEADVGRIDTCADEHVEIVVHDVFQLFNHITTITHLCYHLPNVTDCFAYNVLSNSIDRQTDRPTDQPTNQQWR